MRAFQLVILALVLWRSQPCQGSDANSRAPATDKHAARSLPAPAAETFKLEAEIAALDKTLTNVVQALAQPAQAAAPASASQHSTALAVALVLAGILVLQRFGPRIANYLNMRASPARAAPFGAGSSPAEEKSFSEFAEVFATGPSGGPCQPAPSECVSASDIASTTQHDCNRHNDPLEEFLDSALKDLATVRDLLSQIGRAPDEAARQKTLSELSSQISSLKGKSGLPAMLPVWQMICALEALLNQLISKPSNVNPSTLRTIANAVDLLQALCVRGLNPDLATEPPVRLLAVDDDAISRHAISFALKKVFSEPDLAGNGKTALVLAEEHHYDVIFLDVEMPGMDGFELCSRIHETGPNRTTPVVFVTRHSDFNSRAKSSMTGARELIGKPFLIFEVAVKALTLVLRQRLQSHERTAAPQSECFAEQPERLALAPEAAAALS